MTTPYDPHFKNTEDPYYEKQLKIEREMKEEQEREEKSYWLEVTDGKTDCPFPPKPPVIIEENLEEQLTILEDLLRWINFQEQTDLSIDMDAVMYITCDEYKPEVELQSEFYFYRLPYGRSRFGESKLKYLDWIKQAGQILKPFGFKQFMLMFDVKIETAKKCNQFPRTGTQFLTSIVAETLYKERLAYITIPISSRFNDEIEYVEHTFGANCTLRHLAVGRDDVPDIQPIQDKILSLKKQLYPERYNLLKGDSEKLSHTYDLYLYAEEKKFTCKGKVFKLEPKQYKLFEFIRAQQKYGSSKTLKELADKFQNNTGTINKDVSNINTVFRNKLGIQDSYKFIIWDGDGINKKALLNTQYFDYLN